MFDKKTKNSVFLFLNFSFLNDNFSFFFSPQIMQVVDNGFSRFIILLEIPWMPE